MKTESCVAVATLLLAGLSGSQAFNSHLPKASSSLEKHLSKETICFVSNISEEEARLLDLRSSYSERCRPYRRSYFQHDEWLEHRSFDRLPEIIIGLLDSGVVRQVTEELLSVVAVAVFAILWNAVFVTGFTDFNGVDYMPLFQDTGLPKAVLPEAPFKFASGALSALLVFRTNVAYKRWDEARKAWGVIVNHSRNLLRQGASWVTDEIEPDPEVRREQLKYFTNSVWAFARSLQRHLWGAIEDDEDFQRDVRERLQPFEAEGLISARHKPTRANNDLTRAVNQLPLTYLRKIEIDKSVIEFANAMGACDRIFTSPVPIFYTRHTARFLSLWILALPLALYDSFGYTWNHIGLVPAVALVSFFFFGIEELSVSLEEPFSILPLHKITEGIGLSADEHLEWSFEEGGTKSGHSTPLYMYVEDRTMKRSE